MSERKTIQINPSLFEFSSKKTRQKKPKIEGEIKMKSTISKTPKNKSLKNGILKMIREKQQNDYQKLFSEKPTNASTKPNSAMSTEIDTFKNEFQESIEYLKTLEEKEKKNPAPNLPKNKTLKNYDSFGSPPGLPQLPMQNTPHPFNRENTGTLSSGISNIENVNLSLPAVFSSMPPVNEIKLKPPVIQNSTYNYKPHTNGNPQNPQWGCLKVGGKLPTYRSWMNATQKNRGTTSPALENNNVSNQTMSTSIRNINQPVSVVDAPQPASAYPESVVNLMKESQIERIKQKSTIKQMKTQMDNLNKPVKVKQLKQRKIARRTYRIGKSKVLPKVSVLVSNRTLRNNITTKAQLLKQTPINEIKRFLIKRGFIKVGSNTPNDILRKMYESVSLICGEVQNHNSENLLYNFLHGGM